MGGRSLAALALAAAVAIGLAVFISRSRSAAPAPTADAESSLLVPRLKDSIDQVTAVTIKDASGEVRLVRGEGDVWNCASEAGYPAKPNAVSQLLLTLSNQDSGEAKTNDPALYAEIGVGDAPLSADASMITLEDAKGDALASVIFGKVSERIAGRRFVQVVGQDRARLIDVKFSPSTTLRNWVDPELTRIAKNRITAITVQPIDAPPIDIDLQAEGPNAGRFVVAGLPDGRVTNQTGPLDQLGAALAWLDFEHALPRTGDPSDQSLVTTTYRMNGGWSVVVQTWMNGATPTARLELIEPATKPEGDDAATVDAELEIIRKRFAGWDFVIPRARFETLRPTIEALTGDADPGAPSPPAN